MKKILVTLLVLALCAPAMAATISGVDNGGLSATVTISADGAANLVGLGLDVDVDGGAGVVVGDGAAEVVNDAAEVVDVDGAVVGDGGAEVVGGFAVIALHKSVRRVGNALIALGESVSTARGRRHSARSSKRRDQSWNAHPATSSR